MIDNLSRWVHIMPLHSLKADAIADALINGNTSNNENRQHALVISPFYDLAVFDPWLLTQWIN